MKAIVQDRYGPAMDVLKVEDIDKPKAKPGEVLLRVRAASIHIGDGHVMRGAPKLMRPLFGLRRPKQRVPGSDVAGVVEAVGSDVTDWHARDEVLGWCTGAFAEFVAVSGDQLVAKPPTLSFEEAAALPTSGMTALQAIRDHGHVESGQTVLINGAAGGVGTFAVQIAKAYGAEVTGVCSTRNVELVSSIGADHVVDYTVDDFTRGEQRYDLILDNVGNHSFSGTRRALTPDGRLLSNGAPVEGWIGGLDHVVKAFVQSLFVRQQGRPFVSLPNQADLTTLTELNVSGKVTPAIDQVYPLSEAAAAMSHVVAGHARGKVVINVAEPGM